MNDVKLHRLYIHGQYTDASSGKTFDSINPATGEVIATIQQASQADIEAAVKSGARLPLVVRPSAGGPFLSDGQQGFTVARGRMRHGPLLSPKISSDWAGCGSPRLT